MAKGELRRLRARISRDCAPLCDPRRAAAPEPRDEPLRPRNFGKISGQFRPDFGDIS
jgi:hypothetical protein